MTAYAQYTPQALHREEFATRTLTAGGNGNGGDIIQCADGLAGVVQGMKPYVTGELITVRLVDAYDVPCASGTGFADGADVFWNSTTKLAVTTLAAGNFKLGSARGTKASGATAVRTMFNNASSVLNSTSMTFTGGTGANAIVVPTNLADALDVKDSVAVGLASFATTTGSPAMTVSVATTLGSTLTVTGAATLNSTLAMNGHITMGDAKNIVLNATTGTKIGTAATQKLGFYNAAPVVQPAVVAAAKVNYTTLDLDTEAEIITAMNATNTTLNAVLTALKNLGLMASS